MVGKIILAILGGSIEVEQNFNVLGVFTSLRRCQLGVENLDSLVMIYKNWPNDVKAWWSVANEDVTKFFVAKADLVEFLKVELNETGMFEE
jgi:hypothetical protein